MSGDIATQNLEKFFSLYLPYDLVLCPAWCGGAFAVAIGTNLINNVVVTAPAALVTVNPSNQAFVTGSLLGLLITVLLAPILEEFAFRQLMLNMWLRLVRPWLAVAAVALSFALFHMPYPIVDGLSLWKFFVAEVPSLFIVGLALGAVRLRLSLWHAIVFHMAVNGLL